MIQLLKTIGDSKDSEEKIEKVGQSMNLSHFEVLSEKSLYKKRKRRDFASQVERKKAAGRIIKRRCLKIKIRFIQDTNRLRLKISLKLTCRMTIWKLRILISGMKSPLRN